MKRRDFMALVGAGVLLQPTVARPQQSSRKRIGVLFALPEANPQAKARLATFREELQKLGWSDITIDARYVAANDAETHLRYAKELVSLQPDLILAQNTDATAAPLQHTRTIPIVFTIVADPIGSGYVESFRRPGGNITGFVPSEPTMGGKWLELLKEIAPNVERVLVPFNGAERVVEYFLQSLRATAAIQNVDARANYVRDLTELEAVIAAHALTPQGGVVFFPDAYFTGHRAEVTSLLGRYRLPTIYPYRFFAESGGLFSYGSDLLDNFRRAALYADRILKGASVSELPVQAPEKFELVINLNTAKSLGLSVPQSLLGRADDVIER